MEYVSESEDDLAEQSKVDSNEEPTEPQENSEECSGAIYRAISRLQWLIFGINWKTIEEYGKCTSITTTFFKFFMTTE